MSVTTTDTERVEQIEETLRSNVLELTTVITKRQPYFHRVALRCVANVADAEDAVQDAFLAAWKHLGQFNGQAQMSTWLTAIVVNSSRTIVRKRAYVRLLPIDGQAEGNTQLSELLPDRRPDPEAQYRHSEYECRLRHLLTRLSPILQVIVQMRSIDGRSIQETAEALGLTESAVKTRASRARAELRRLDRKTSGWSLSAPSPATHEANESVPPNFIEPAPQHSSRTGFVATPPRNTMQ